MATSRRKAPGARKRAQPAKTAAPAKKTTRAAKTARGAKTTGGAKTTTAAKRAGGATPRRAASANRNRTSQALLPEFDQEMASTRRLLERVPADKGTWKPHPKSFSLGHLAQLVAWIPGWIANAVQQTELDLAAAPGYSYLSTEELLRMFDANVREARAAIASSRDADYDVDWSLRMGDRVIMTQPRAAVVRTHISHLSHHRGQLTVYLRLVDVPIPSIYGPTADERAPAF